MAERRKPRRRPLGYFEAQDKLTNLSNIYRTAGFGMDRTRMARQAHQELDDVPTPEPDAELADSELSDAERESAIARERMRREGRA